jgi:hypothetical protein
MALSQDRAAYRWYDEAVLCPDDGNSLTEETAGVSSCKRCLGRALSARVFSELHPGVREVLRREEDRTSGAYARQRRCPNCQQAMVPLRVDTLFAWLDWCEPCEILWVEKLDVSVIEGLRSRWARARAVASIPVEEWRQMAAEIAHELAEHQRDLRIIKTIERLLWAIQGL